MGGVRRGLAKKRRRHRIAGGVVLLQGMLISLPRTRHRQN